MDKNDKKKSPLLIIAILTFAVAVLTMVFRTGDPQQEPDHTQMPEYKISEQMHVASQKEEESSWFGASLFKRIFGSSEEVGDLTQGADHPDYVRLMDDIDRLYEEFAMLPEAERDEKTLILDQASLVADYQLGEDFPHKEEFLEIVEWSYDARQPLNEKFFSGEIDQVELFTELNQHFDELAEKYASIFTDDEYMEMFNLEKGQSLAESMGLTPEVARAMEEAAMQQGPVGGLTEESYHLTDDYEMTEEQREAFEKEYGDPPDFPADQ